MATLPDRSKPNADPKATDAKQSRFLRCVSSLQFMQDKDLTSDQIGGLVSFAKRSKFDKIVEIGEQKLRLETEQAGFLADTLIDEYYAANGGQATQRGQSNGVGVSPEETCLVAKPLDLVDLFNTAKEQIEMDINCQYFLQCLHNRDANGMKYYLRQIPLFKSNGNVLDVHFDYLYVQFLIVKNETTIQENKLETDTKISIMDDNVGVTADEISRHSEKHSQTDTELQKTKKKVNENTTNVKTLQRELGNGNFILSLITLGGLLTYLPSSIDSIVDYFGDYVLVINTPLLLVLVMSYTIGYLRELKGGWWTAQQLAHVILFATLTFVLTRITGLKLSLVEAIIVYIFHYIFMVIVALFVCLETYHFKDLVMNMWYKCTNKKKVNSLSDHTNNSTSGEDTGSRQQLANIEQNDEKENDKKEKDEKESNRQEKEGDETGVATPARVASQADILGHSNEEIVNTNIGFSTPQNVSFKTINTGEQ